MDGGQTRVRARGAGTTTIRALYTGATVAMVAALSLAPLSPARAADHFVEARPGAAQELIDANRLAGGDRVVLAPGRHGALLIRGQSFEDPVTLTSAEPGRATFDRLRVENATGWRFEGLTVRPSEIPPAQAALVSVDRGRDIQFERLHIASAEDTTDWTAQAWRRNARNGMSLSGQDITVRDSHIRNIRHGIDTDADGMRVETTVIELFSGDGIRALGDRSDYIGNTIRTCVDVDDNHDDGFQSWSRDRLMRPGRGVVRHVRVEDNRIENGDHPLQCTLQGIGLFDGFFEDWTIRNNTIIVDHWHGITVMGGRRVRVTDNIAVDSRPDRRPGAPWITVTAHKDGRPSEDSVIEGNVTQAWAGGNHSQFKQPQPGVRVGRNRIVRTPEAALGADP